jgi:cytochrome P450
MYLNELIEERRKDNLKGEKYDLLSNMVRSADASENEKARLSPSELLGYEDPIHPLHSHTNHFFPTEMY